MLVLVAEGLSSKAIASRLGISPRTVESHREKMMSKLGIHNAAGLARHAATNGLGRP